MHCSCIQGRQENVWEQSKWARIFCAGLHQAVSFSPRVSDIVPAVFQLRLCKVRVTVVPKLQALSIPAVIK
jgi:hypothetical protein